MFQQSVKKRKKSYIWGQNLANDHTTTFVTVCQVLWGIILIKQQQ